MSARNVFLIRRSSKDNEPSASASETVESVTLDTTGTSIQATPDQAGFE
jgi:hypothetical protein